MEHNEVKGAPACEGGRYRRLTGAQGVIAKALTFLLPALGLVYLTDLPLLFGGAFKSQVYLPLFLGIALVLVFMMIPPDRRKGQASVPWYDWVLVGISATATLYPAVNYRSIFLAGAFEVSPGELVLGILFVIVTAEAVRRTVGMSMVIIITLFLVHARFANLFPSLLSGPEASLGQVMRFVYLSDQGVLGPILALGGTILLAFLLFGSFLSMGRSGETFMKMAVALVGKARGGVAKVAVVSSCLVGSITGSPVANVMITGSFTIPMMKRSGYKPVFAGAVEAVASTGGIVMPPVMGAVAFVAADLTGLGYAKIALSAVIPAILYYLAVFLQIHFRAGKVRLSGLEEGQVPRLSEALKEGLPLMIPFAVLVALLLVVQYNPVKSALIATLLLIALRFIWSRFTVREFLEAFSGTSLSLVEVIPVIAASGIVIGSVSLTGIGINISNLILKASGGSLVLLVILSGAATYILGMGVSAIASYIILATLVAPAMIQSGIPLLVAHMFLLYMGASMFITPPYATAAYAAATLAGANPMAVGFQAMKLGIVAYLVPFISVFNPSLLLMGSVEDVAVALVTATCGVIALAASLEGFLWGKLSWVERTLLFPAGLALAIPGLSTDLPGAAVAVVICFLNWRRNRPGARSAAEALGAVGDGL